MVDQLVGQYMAHVCGLGYLGNRDNMRSALQSVWRYNYVSDFSRHFNNMRSYVLGNEAGLLMASWPKGRLKVPFPYFAEVMTGFEYCAATSMIQEGLTDEALKVIGSIRARYDGAKRNPFSEAECGYHYARSMASWAPIIAWCGFNYSGITQSMSVADREGCYFWSNGSAWGLLTVSAKEVKIDVLYGKLVLKTLSVGDRQIRQSVSLNEGDSFVFKR
ncbi:MAG: GH116 family glycosyl hydrolase [Bacteroidaceae bacterium]